MKTSKFYQYKNFESDQKSLISDKNKFFSMSELEILSMSKFRRILSTAKTESFGAIKVFNFEVLKI